MVRESALLLDTCGERVVLYINKSGKYIVTNMPYRLFLYANRLFQQHTYINMDIYHKTKHACT